VKPPVAPTIESMEGEFKVRRATMRGVTYVIKELPADEYEKCLRAATSTDEETGRDRVNNETLFKLMLDKALVEPKMKVAEVFAKPYPVIRKLSDIVDELHYTPEIPDEDRVEDDDEGEVTA
jgi:hypothetical protein